MQKSQDGCECFEFSPTCSVNGVDAMRACKRKQRVIRRRGKGNAHRHRSALLVEGKEVCVGLLLV